MKFTVRTLCSFFIFFSATLHAQNAAEIDFVKSAGNYLEIHNGMIEVAYNTQLYSNLPYYSVVETSGNLFVINGITYTQETAPHKRSDFTEGTIWYKDNVYPGQQVRIDLYKNQLIVKTPETNFGIVVENQGMKKVTMYGKTFIWHVPEAESGMKEGYYIQLFNSDRFMLLNKESYAIDKRQTTYSFSLSRKYYVLMNGKYYQVKNKKSFSKLFPQFKNQINQYCKQNNLDFGRNNTETSLAKLAAYCYELLTSNSSK